MTKEDIIKPENLVYKKPTLMNDNPMHYCPGCSHGVVHKLIAEVIEEMGMEDKAIGISPVGCAVFIYNYLDIDWQEAAHGRAPALATAIKRLWPSRLVFTYQGDGDLACIGTAETIHALNRGENITIGSKTQVFLELLGNGKTSYSGFCFNIDAEVSYAVDFFDNQLVIRVHARNFQKRLFDLFRKEINSFDDEHIIAAAGDGFQSQVGSPTGRADITGENAGQVFCSEANYRQRLSGK